MQCSKTRSLMIITTVLTSSVVHWTRGRLDGSFAFPASFVLSGDSVSSLAASLSGLDTAVSIDSRKTADGRRRRTLGTRTSSFTSSGNDRFVPEVEDMFTSVYVISISQQQCLDRWESATMMMARHV